MKILIAADGSEYTKRMLAYVAAHDEWLGAQHQYTVVHSVLAVPHRAASFVSIEMMTRFYDEDAESVFRPIRAFFEQQGIHASYVHTIGHAAASIARMAEEGRYDLLMLGARGHGALVNLVLGSIATKIIAGCTVPVLLVR
ncbi:MAG: universal stress protein [Caldimonas sp.]